MAERSTSLTMPQNRPNDDDDKPALLTSSTTTRDGEGVKIEVSPATDGPANDKTGDTTDNNRSAKASQAPDVTSNEGTSTPVKDTASIKTADSHPQYKFSRSEERRVLQFISRSHAVIDADPSSAFKSDQEILKLTEMVSQMTHLLAASGMVRRTPVSSSLR